jgi:hypothetical protein
MTMQINRNAAFFAVGGLIAVWFLAGAAHAITDTVFRYSTPKNGTAMYGAAAFGPQNAPSTYHNGLVLQNIGSVVCYWAPVNNLPQGAKLTALVMFYVNDQTAPWSTELSRIRLAAPASSESVAQLTPPNSHGDFRSARLDITDPSMQIVDNLRYVYVMSRCVGSTEYFYSARLDYTYTTAGD